EPVLADEKLAQQRGFRAAGRGMPVVAPFYDRRQRHQNRFRAPSRLQAEQGAPVIYQIELDIAAAAISLEIALALIVFHVSAPLGDGQIGAEEAVADALRQAEAVREGIRRAAGLGRVEIVEE